MTEESQLNPIIQSQFAFIKNAYGEMAYKDFLILVEASPILQDQIMEYINKGGSFGVNQNVVNQAEFLPGEKDVGTISFAPNVNSFQDKKWSNGYGLVEILAHEIGHALDPSFNISSINTAYEADIASSDGKYIQSVMLRVRSEGMAVINSYRIMSEVRANIISSINVSNDGGYLYDPASRLTGFPHAESIIKYFYASKSNIALADRCSADAACLAMVADDMGRFAGYYNSYFQIVSRSSGNFSLKEVFIENGDRYVTILREDGSLVVLDGFTEEIVYGYSMRADGVTEIFYKVDPSSAVEYIYNPDNSYKEVETYVSTSEENKIVSIYDGNGLLVSLTQSQRNMLSNELIETATT